MQPIIKPLALVATVFACTVGAPAQPGGAGGPAGLDTLFTKFFGEIKAFSATAQMTLKGKDSMSMPMGFAMLDGKIRTDVDLSQAKGGMMEEGVKEQMKKMGMDTLASIVDTEKKTMCIIYPGLKSYAEMPMPKEQAAVLEKEPKIERVDLGKDTVEGHPCKKAKVIMTQADGKKQEALVWNATDLKEFPIQVQMTHEGNEITMLYKDIKLAKPDAKLFLAPAEYTKYDNIQALMQGAMMKMFTNPR